MTETIENKMSLRSGWWFLLVALIVCTAISYISYASTRSSEFNTVWSYKFSSAIWTIVSSYLLLMFMPLPIEQHWIDKVRIGAVLTFGAVVLGIFCWPLVAAGTDREAVVFFNSIISLQDGLLILLASYATGAAAYFIGSPNGKYTAMAAVPMGIGVWAMRSGTMAALLTYNHELALHRDIYMSLRWEGVFWFMALIAGYLGVKTACKICNDGCNEIDIRKQNPGEIVLPLVVTCAIAWLLVNLLAQSPKLPTKQFGVLYSQPRNAQIAFALLAGFGVAGYAVKRFMKVGFEIPAIATVVFSLAAAIFSGKEEIQSISMNMPAAFFKHPVSAIMPIHIITFGTLGILLGYSIAILGNHKKQLAAEPDIQTP